MPQKIFVIIVAAGKGLRMGSQTRKQYLEIGGIPVLSRTLMTFERSDQIDEIILVVPKKDTGYCQKQVIAPFGFSKPIHLVAGGKERQISVLNGIEWIRNRGTDPKDTLVLIHDGVRPFVGDKTIQDCIEGAIEYGACIPALQITDTVKQVCPDFNVQKTLDRTFLYTAQTPQAFRLDLICQAFDHAKKTCFSATDDASLVEHLGHRVVLIKGSSLNLKITTPQDLLLGKYLLRLND